MSAMPGNVASTPPASGFIIARVVLAQLVLAAVLAGILFLTGTIDGDADNQTDPIAGIPESQE